MNRTDTSANMVVVSQRKPLERVARQAAVRPHRIARQRMRSSLRSRVLAAFQDLAHATSPQAAFVRTKNFYGSSGADWTLSLK